MVRLSGSALALAGLTVCVSAVPLEARSASEPYAPYSASCPAQPLVRLSDDHINDGEQTFISARTPIAETALLSWLEKTLDSWPSKRSGWGSWGGSGGAPWGGHPGWAPSWFPNPYNKLPRLALALSGGGPKAGLTAAGVMQGLDSRDSNTGVSGLLQSMTYLSGLSGGSLTVGSVVINNFATVSSLRTALWNFAYQNPFDLAVSQAGNITAQVNSKVAAGYAATLLDLFGRVESYDFLSSDDGGAGITWSSVLEQSSFQSAQAPFPLLALSDSNAAAGQCESVVPGAVWEITPLEFGSWDPSVAAFAQTKYLGTNLTNGSPDTANTCTLNFDNAGFFVGVSTNIVVDGQHCGKPPPKGTLLPGLAGELEGVYTNASIVLSEYGLVRNPFYELSGAGNISARDTLYMADGGFSGQGIPIEPFLQPAREIDVIFAVDENSSPPENITNGANIYETYLAAQLVGLKNMPPAPNVTEQAALNFSNSAHFLGCYNPLFTTIVYLPNSLETQTTSSDFFFTPEKIDLVITEGTDIVTQSNSTEWPKCVACAVMHKHAPFLFDECASCLEKYCYVPGN